VTSVSMCVPLVGASVPDDAVPMGERIFPAGLVHRSVLPLRLPACSRVAQHCAPNLPCCALGVALTEALLGCGPIDFFVASNALNGLSGIHSAWSPICVFFL
jgi:hypothetical protein